MAPTSLRPSYVFADQWFVAGDPDRVYALLGEIGNYPTWWPQVRAVAKIDDETALVACRSVLPYTLHFEMGPARQDAQAGVLEAALEGDIVGWCRWRVSAVEGGTRLDFDQEVRTPGRTLQVLARLARPLLVLNHHLMMRGGRRGLVERMSR